MPQQTPAQARVVDPILTTAARGYRNTEFVGSALFPRVPVTARGGKIITFGKEDFALYATARAPGAATKRVQYGYAGAPYSLVDHRLEGTVPIENMEEAAAVPGINAARLAVTKTQNIIDLGLEKEQADLATTAGNYDAAHKNTALTGSTLWSDLSASDPIANIEAGKEAIRATTGRYPNTLVLGAVVMKSLRRHSKIVDLIKYTSSKIVTEDILAALLGLKQVLVGGAIYTDATGAFVDVWGKNAVLAYTELGSLADAGVPSYGYTYRLNDRPFVEAPYEDRNSVTWNYPVNDARQAVIAGAEAGYLISPAVA